MNIDQVSSTKFLGVIINQTLTWNDHNISHQTKISKNINIASHIRRNPICSHLLLLYSV